MADAIDTPEQVAADIGDPEALLLYRTLNVEALRRMKHAFQHDLRVIKAGKSADDAKWAEARVRLIKAVLKERTGSTL